jgi:long-subunit fatty acid transport protein
MKFKKLAMGVAMAVAGMSQAPVYATNGMLMIGAGFRSQGMGGTGIASGRDAVSVGANPANAVNTGMRGDMGVGIFNAERSARIDTTLGTGTFDFVDVGTVESDNKYFIMPEMGMTMPLTEQVTVGMAFIPNGGGNSTFRKNFFSYAPGVKQYPHEDTTLGVDLMQQGERGPCAGRLPGVRRSALPFLWPGCVQGGRRPWWPAL